MAIKTFPVILTEVRQLTPNTRHLVFERADGEVLTFIPGQFISIHFDHQGEELRRSYSLATMPGVSTKIEFAISYFKGGPASEFIFNLDMGQTLQFSGPYGRLILRDEQPARYLLIATGTGVTPYRAMLSQLRERFATNPNLEVVLLLGVQRRCDQLYTEDFLAFQQEQPRFKFIVSYSREEDQQLQSYERLGRLQHVFEEIAPNAASDIVYLCGNPNMIDDSYALLKDKGFAVQQVRREKYVS